MKILFLLASFWLVSTAFAQSAKHSDIKMQAKYGAENVELQSVLSFENINLYQLTFSGNDLKNKNFQISVKQFVNGRLSQTEVIFDSKEDDYFKIKSDVFAFRVLTKTTSENTVKFDFQFNGFSKAKEYKIAANQKTFALKSFLGSQPELSIPLNANTYVLTYMMPYVRKDGSSTYCEVAQSGVNPEELGTKYPIPLYFLIDIKFH